MADTVKVPQQNEIHITKEYDRFKRVKGNRPIYRSHVQLLVATFKAKPDAMSYNPILVNDKFEVIDGQHRIAAAKQIGAPVYYIMHNNLGLQEIQELNSGSKPWGPMDFAQSYQELGKLDYRLYIEFAGQYPLNHDTLRYVLSKNSCNLTMFKTGRFKIHDVQRATDILTKLMQFAPYYERFTDRKFTWAFFKMYNNPDYHHEHMLHQLEKYPEAARTEIDTPEYLRQLETIYNTDAGHLNAIRFF